MKLYDLGAIFIVALIIVFFLWLYIGGRQSENNDILFIEGPEVLESRPY